MRQLLALLHLRSFILSLAIINIRYVHTQILYECNFDISTENCFTTEIDVTSNIGIPNSLKPDGPLSDVTSSCKKNQHFAISYVNTLCFCLCSETDG
jgi:hypothetical protein